MALTAMERRDIRIFKEKEEVIVSERKVVKKAVPETKRQKLLGYLKKHDLE